MTDPAGDLELRTDAAGVVLPIQAQPKAKTNGIVGLHAGRVKVAVTAAPENGKANAALRGVLAKSLRLKKRQVQIIAGETSAKKSVLITEISSGELSSRIAAALKP